MAAPKSPRRHYHLYASATAFLRLSSLVITLPILHLPTWAMFPLRLREFRRVSLALLSFSLRAVLTNTISPRSIMIIYFDTLCADEPPPTALIHITIDGREFFTLPASHYASTSASILHRLLIERLFLPMQYQFWVIYLPRWHGTGFMLSELPPCDLFGKILHDRIR